jgi:hypothetical protein
MGDRRPAGETEYSPLDDSTDLIGRVLAGAVVVEEPSPQPVPTKILHIQPKVERPVSQPPLEKHEEPEVISAVPEFTAGQTEEQVVFKFRVSRSDYIHAKRIISSLAEELEANIDISNVGRGWLTRFIMAEKEILEAAKHQERLKTPNSRSSLEIAEIDHAMTVIQSLAFRRAAAVK